MPKEIGNFSSTVSRTTIIDQNSIHQNFILIVARISLFSATFLRQVERDRRKAESTKKSDVAANEESESEEESELSGEDLNDTLGSEDIVDQ